ncbi:MAG: hypothetical protein DRJ42_09875 [Deltaproteobacteria bacterium]|nr:MAG: hypothetical protein DRJ42_09875 [Deltaproteobacteria bacterium]
MKSTRPRESIRSGLADLAPLGALAPRLLALLFALVSAVVVGPTVARAHLGHAVQSAERYLKVDFEGGHVRVVVSLMLGPGEAARVLRVADREDGDGDGTLTPTEADAYLARWGVGLGEDLVLELDGAAVRVDWGEAYLDPSGPISHRPATVEMIARVPLSAGEHHLVLRDGMRRETFERTDVAFSGHDGAELVASGVGEERPSARVPAIAFAGARGPDVFSAVAVVEGSSRGGGLPGDAASEGPAAGHPLGDFGALEAGALAVVILVSAGLLMLWRRRRP